VLRIAARNPQLAAVIAQTPLADGPAAGRNAMRHQTPLASCRLVALAVLDEMGRLLGRPPLLVPLAARPGTVAALTTPDAIVGGQALDPDNRYPDWRQAVAAGSALRLGAYRPGRDAARVCCPLLVVTCDEDRSALYGSAVEAARRAPDAELVVLSGGHYAPFMSAHQQAADAELDFLHRHVAASGSVAQAQLS
jgi:pimeloyl-ACP methyl ester carboxylesterase